MAINLKEKILSKTPKNGKYYLVAIDGRGGAGKTTLTKYMSSLLPDFIFINGDGYFEPTPNSVAWGEFNNERFELEVIEPLRNGKNKIAYRPYNWHKKPPITERIINIDKGICIERSFIFSFDLDWDLKIWLETPPGVALERAQVRDQMPLEQGLKAWLEVWQPMEDKHINKIKPLETADIVINGTRPFEEQIL
ncbi:MAG TPA: hypothetical protein VMR18_00610 [Candidatus Saccharimonadales bacterium]|nr:hypothetical protein [Candidatus Saccharimonadales bacterium]